MKAMNQTHAIAIKKLQRIGIKTVKDLDDKKGNDSRFDYLKSLVGFDGAMWVLNDLAIVQCFK
jgi:hypothetical protein